MHTVCVGFYLYAHKIRIINVWVDDFLNQFENKDSQCNIHIYIYTYTLESASNFIVKRVEVLLLSEY